MKADPISVDPTTPQATPDGDFANASIHYALCDRKYDVIAMIDSADNLAERVRYSAYGVAQIELKGDFNGDGAVNA